MGTGEYCAPELFSEAKTSKYQICTYTEKTEVYALGICLQEILLNCIINWDSWLKKAVVFYNTGTIFENDKLLGITELIEDMTDYNAKRRPTLNSVIKKLNDAKEIYILKYPKENESTQEIYKNAEQQEMIRLLKIYHNPKNEKFVGHSTPLLRAY